MWENLQRRQREGATLSITPQDLQELGDVDQALSGFYEQALKRVAAQTGQSERRLREWFSTELITPARSRGLVYRGETETGGLPNAVVDSLAGEYIIRAELRSGETWYELTHDRLVGPVLEANLRWQAEYYNPVAAAYTAWQNAGRSPDRLLSGAQLQEAQTFAASQPLEMTGDEKAFLADSQRQAEEARQQARQAAQRRNIIIGAALVVAVLMSLLALWGWDRAVEAEQQQATAETAGTAVAQQLEATAARLEFSRTAALEERLALLVKLIELDRAEMVIELFDSLPTQADQLALLKVPDKGLIEVGQVLVMTMAEVGRSGYGDPFLEAMAAGLGNLSESSQAATAWQSELEQWLRARQRARAGQYEAAKTDYDDLIKGNKRNPALFYERGRVLAGLGQPEDALADLEQMLALVNDSPALFDRGQEVKRIGRLLYQVEPTLGELFEQTKADYPHLAKVADRLAGVKEVEMVLVGHFKSF